MIKNSTKDSQGYISVIDCILWKGEDTGHYLPFEAPGTCISRTLKYICVLTIH